MEVTPRKGTVDLPLGFQEASPYMRTHTAAEHSLHVFVMTALGYQEHGAVGGGCLSQLPPFTIFGVPHPSGHNKLKVAHT